MLRPDYYKALRIARSSSGEDIKRAYRQAARKYHPDSGAENSKEKFQQIVEAYRVLSNETLRRAYDRVLLRQEAIQQTSAKSAEAADKGNHPPETMVEAILLWLGFKGAAKGVDLPHKRFSKDYSPPGSFLADLFAYSYYGLHRLIWRLTSLFGSTEPKFDLDNKSSHSQNKTDDKNALNFTFTIDALESIRGTTKEISIQTSTSTKIVRVKIPSGISDGTVLKIKRGGSPGINEQIISVHVKVTAHPFVRREGLDIIITIPITVGEAVNGTQCQIPTINGPVNVNIPPRSFSTSRKLRLKGRGIEKPEAKGDLYVETHIALPSEITEEVKRKASEFDAAYNRDVRLNVPRSL